MKPGIPIILVVLIVLVISNSQPASATILTVEVKGIVDSLWTGGALALDGSVDTGSAITGFATYDTEAPDQADGGDFGFYPVISISMTIGNYTFAHDPMSPDFPFFRVGTVDDVYIAKSRALCFDGTIYINGSPKTFDEISWGWTYMELFNLWTSSIDFIDELPDLDTWPELSVFDVRRAFETRFYGEGDNDFGIYGEVTSLTVVLGTGTVPEPGTVLLLGLGGLVLLRKRKG